MRKLLLLLLIIIPIVAATDECPRYVSPKDIPCMIISSYKPSAGCSGTLYIYNESGSNIQNLSWGDYTPVCNTTFNMTTVGIYHYNSSIENGVINVQGDDEQLILTISIFLILINLLLFALPFWVRFSPSEAGNYMVKRLMWIGAVLLLWFNTTLFRQLAVDWGLGIDNFLLGYWWMFTLAAFSTILIMCYVMVVGALKLTKEAKMRKRLGEYDYQKQTS